MSKRILLIDDEPSLRRSISIGLNQRGVDVELCENGISALNKIDLYQKNEVNLDTIVLDIQLPDIDGIKLGKIIKAKYPNTSMIYITGYADKLEETEIDDLKVDAFLEKPFDADELMVEINKILDKQPKQPVQSQTAKEEKRTAAAYMLLKIDEKADFFEIYKKLYAMENVLYCDATRGDIDIFLLVQAGTIEECKEIFEKEVKIIDGLKDAEFLPIDVPVLNENITDIINSAGISLSTEIPNSGAVRDSKHSVCSYVLAEVERERIQEVYPILKLTENIVYCDFINGRYNLVMMVSGSQFSQIDKFIENKLINLNGIIKIKKYPIINIYEM
ncbi:MAG: response regulator [Ignavibacteriales bacterium]|nr:response regulator [Ignavibacteriales bacterium]